MQVLQPCDHPAGISLNHHACNFGVRIAVTELHPRHHIRHDADARLQLLQLPPSLGCDGMGFRFNGIIFLKLGLQGLAQPRPHGGIQYTADANLTHLCGFQDGAEHLPIIFHIHHHLQYNHPRENHAWRKSDGVHRILG